LNTQSNKVLEHLDAEYVRFVKAIFSSIAYGAVLYFNTKKGKKDKR